MTRADLRQVAVVAPNLHYRYSGVTATIVAVVPEQAKSIPIAGVGPHLPDHLPQVTIWQVLTRGWSQPPGGRPFRIWHARRNDEMLIGLVLRYILRQPWKLVFTSAAQRRKTGLTKWLMRRMDAILTPSEFSGAFIDLPHTVVHHGVDTAKFQPTANRAEAWAASGLPGHYGIGAFGRVRHQKGSDLFVEAMIRLLPRYPDWTAVMTGLIGAEQAAFANELKARVATAGLENRIAILGERLPEEVPLWFQRVSVYVAPMRNEGFGLTTLEAMSSGAAVVASRTGAAPYVVAEGRTGRIVPPGDLEALIAAIEPLMADPQQAAAMGAAGRTKALAEHALAREAEGINAVYARLWAE